MSMTIEMLNDRVLNYAKRLLLNARQLPTAGEQNIEFINQVAERIERRELSDIPSLFTALGINTQMLSETSDRTGKTIYAFLLQCLTDQDELNRSYLMYAIQEQVTALPQLIAVYELLSPTDLYETLVLTDNDQLNAHEFAFKNKPELACVLLRLSDRLTDEDQIRFLIHNKAGLCHLAFERSSDVSEALLQRLQRLGESHPADVLQIMDTESDHARLLLATAIYHQSAMANGLLTLIAVLGIKLEQDTVSHVFKSSRLRLLDTAIRHHPAMVEPLLSYFDYFSAKDKHKLLAHRDGLSPLSVAILNQPTLIRPVLQRVVELRMIDSHTVLLDVISQVFLTQQVPAEPLWPFIKPVIEEIRAIPLTKAREQTILSLLENLNFTQPGMLDLLGPLINKFMDKAWLHAQYTPRLMINFKGNYPVLLPAMQALDAESRQAHLPRLISGILEAGNPGVSAIFAANLEPQHQKPFNNLLRLSLAKLLWSALFDKKTLPIKVFIQEFNRFSPEDQRDIMLRNDLSLARAGASLLELIAVADDKVPVHQNLLYNLLVSIQRSNAGLFQELLELIEKNSAYNVADFIKKYKLEPRQQYSQMDSSAKSSEDIPETVVDIPDPLPITGTSTGQSGWFTGISLFKPMATALSVLKETAANPSQLPSQ